MAYCPICGHRVEDIDIFCSKCGINLETRKHGSNSARKSAERVHDGSPDYTPVATQQKLDQKIKNYYKNHSHTWQLSVIIFLIWLSIAFLGFGALITFFVFPLLAIFYFIILVIQYYFANGLAEHNDTTRLLYVFFTALGLIYSLFGFIGGDRFDLFGILLGIFVIFTLTFHQQTPALFEPVLIRRPYYQ